MNRVLKFKRYKVGEPFDPSTAQRDTIHLVPDTVEPFTVKMYDIDIYGNVALLAGLPGPEGPVGPPGSQGEPGTGIKIKGSKDSPNQLPSAGNQIGDAYLIDGELWVYDGISHFNGVTPGWINAGRIQGETSYVHFAYANNVEFDNLGNPVNVIGFTLSDSAYKAWIGVYADNVLEDSSDPSKYRWTKVEGPQGPKGDMGTSIKIKGSVNSVGELPLTGNEAGDAYIINSTGNLYVWTEEGMWLNAGKFQGDRAYMHIAYADNIIFDANGFPIDQTGFTTNDSADKYWIGIYSDNIAEDSTDYKDYKWTKLPQGPKGEPGTGINIKGSLESPDLLPDTDNQIGDAYLINDELWIYNGISQIAGATSGWYNAGKMKGDNAYLHIAYADSIIFDTDGLTPTAAVGFSTSDSKKNWMGVYSDNSETDSTDFHSYKWTYIVGDPGPQGPAGSDGTSVNIKGSVASPDLLPNSGNILGDGYIIDGELWVYDNTTNTPGATFGWVNVGRIQGDSAYFHIAYADSIGFDTDGNPISESGFTVSNNPGSSKSWMGTYADNTLADSNDFRDYTWLYVRGPQGLTGNSGISPVHAILTNEISFVEALNDGTVTSYEGAGTELHVYDGTTELIYDNIGSVNGTYKVDTYPTDVVVGSRTTMEYGKGVRFGNPSGINKDTIKASIRFECIIKTLDGRTLSIPKVQSIDKNRKGPNGEDAKTIKLTATSYVIYRSKAGSISPTTILISAILKNTTINSWQYSINGAAFTATEPSYITVTGAQNLSLNANEANFNTLSIKARNTSDNVEDIITITKLSDGNDGLSSPLMYLTSSSQVMRTDANNVAQSGQSIELEVKKQNISGNPTFSVIPYNDSNTALTSITLDAGDTLDKKILPYTKWQSIYKKVIIQAVLGTLSDKVTIYRLPEGAAGQDAITGFITNENATLPANLDGIVSSYANAAGEFIVYEGQNRVPNNSITFSVVSNTNCTATINSSGIYSVSSMVNTAFSANVKFRAVYKGVTIDCVLTLTKSTPGLPGAIVVQKEWVTGDTHRNNVDIVDFIYHRNTDTWYRLKNGYDNVVAASTPNSTQYEEIPWMKFLAVQNLLVENANIGNLIFKDQALISLKGTVNGVEANYDGQSNFIPNIYINGYNGTGHFAGGNISWDTAGNVSVVGSVASKSSSGVLISSMNYSGDGYYIQYYPSGKKKMQFGDGFITYFNDDAGNTEKWKLGSTGIISAPNLDPLAVGKVSLTNGWTIEVSGTELHFKYNGTTKQRMLTDGSIVSSGEVTAYTSAT